MSVCNSKALARIRYHNIRLVSSSNRSRLRWEYRRITSSLHPSSRTRTLDPVLVLTRPSRCSEPIPRRWVASLLWGCRVLDWRPHTSSNPHTSSSSISRLRRPTHCNPHSKLSNPHNSLRSSLRSLTNSSPRLVHRTECLGKLRSVLR